MIRYVVGDATAPIIKPAIVAHVCNDVGAWGAGFVLAISKRWPGPERSYRRSFRMEAPPGLGDVQIVACEPGVVVANMFAQTGVSGPRPWLRYDALESCLNFVASHAREIGASIHCPRIGCGIAGGTWAEVEPILDDACRDVDVVVYDLPQKDS